MKVEALKQTCSQAYPKSVMHVQEALVHGVLQFITIIALRCALIKKPWAFVGALNMNPQYTGVIRPGYLNQFLHEGFIRVTDPKP